MGMKRNKKNRAVLLILLTCGLTALIHLYVNSGNPQTQLQATVPKPAMPKPAMPSPVIAEPPENRSEVVQHSVMLNEREISDKIAQFETALKVQEKGRSSVISRIDNEQISHIKLLITAPTAKDEELLNKRIDELRAAAEKLENNEALLAQLRKLKDYTDFGMSKRSERYRNRILEVNILHAEGGRLMGNLHSYGADLQYGINQENGAPWVKGSGPNMTRALREENLLLRYGHLVSVKDNP
jgi:hypothetical protein